MCWTSTRHQISYVYLRQYASFNKANLKDLIAATELIILPKSIPHRRLYTRVTLKWDVWPRYTIGNLFPAPRVYVGYFAAISEFEFELSGTLEPGTFNSRAKSSFWLPMGPCNLTHELETQYGTSPMLITRGTLLKWCDRQTSESTDRQTNRQTDRQADITVHTDTWPQLKI